MAIDATVVQLVRRRARERCEYCRLPAGASLLPLVIDHVIARQHGGSDDPANLALACPSCNLSKGPNIASIVAETGELVRLFHPRSDSWVMHFVYDGPRLTSLTEVGEATIRILAINRPDAVRFRRQLLTEGLSFQPPAKPKG